MRIVTGIILMIGGLLGVVIGFLGTIEVTSQITFLDGLELSIALVAFSIVVFINGIANLFMSND